MEDFQFTVEKGGFFDVVSRIGCTVVVACFCLSMVAVTVGFMRWVL